VPDARPATERCIAGTTDVFIPVARHHIGRLEAAIPDYIQTMLPAIGDFLPRALLAILCGGIVGVEREMRRKPAGFRTNILICLGSMLFMWLSARVAAGAVAGAPADPGRIAAQVVTGIGFLGAGTIIHSRGYIRGLTSAAMIWVVAAIGMSIGAGFEGVGVLTTGLVLAVQVGLMLFERRLFGRCVYRECQVVIDGDRRRVRGEIERAARAYGVPMDRFRVDESGDRMILRLQYCEVHPQHKRILSQLWSIDGVLEVQSRR
jgi:putative Mg2+ transporter-C (MgtC) family protein